MSDLKNNTIINSCDSNVPDNIPPPPKLHRQVAGIRNCEICGINTSNSCGICSDCPKPNCIHGNHGNHGNY